MNHPFVVRSAPRRRGNVRRLTTRLQHSALDARIARGEPLDEDPALAVRAAELTELTARRRLARNLERAISDSMRPRGLSPAVPVHPCALAEARPALEQLVVALRCPEPVRPRGVALVERLLIDGGSPLYTGGGEETLEARARRALLELHIPITADPRPRAAR
jgi:hypothetical protein